MRRGLDDLLARAEADAALRAEADRRPRVHPRGRRDRADTARARRRSRTVALPLTVEAPRTGRPAAAGPATAQAGAAAASVVAAAARVAGDATGAARPRRWPMRLRRLAEEDAEALEAARAAFPDAEPASVRCAPRLRVRPDARPRRRGAARDRRGVRRRGDPCRARSPIASILHLGPDLEAAARLAGGAAQGGGAPRRDQPRRGRGRRTVRRARRAAGVA